jgi:serine/threonine protein phosphatase PrpC
MVTRPTITMATAQGRRDYQEDRWVAAELAGGKCLAVFDGHRGPGTAQEASHALVPALKEVWEKSSTPAEAIRTAVTSLSEQMKHLESGCTLSLVFIPEAQERAWGAVLGDSPIAIRDAEGKLVIGPNHNVRENDRELRAALARGAVFDGGYIEDPLNPTAGLQMARTLGDGDLDRILNREPEIFSVPLGPESVILVGTDGLIGNFEGPIEQQLGRLIELIRQGADAQAIVNDALERATRDNVTAIVWKY